MSIFSFFKKEKIDGENTSKPFHENKTKEERIDWFAKTRPWHRITKEVINSLEDVYGDDPKFEIFVIKSMELDLVSKYEKLPSGESAEVIRAMISGILYETGSQSAKYIFKQVQSGSFNQNKVSAALDIAYDCLESSAFIDKNLVAAFLYLARLKQLLNRPQEGIVFAQKGLAALSDLEDVPFHKSAIPSIQKAAETNALIKRELQALIDNFENT
jgi:hypothetical protein